MRVNSIESNPIFKKKQKLFIHCKKTAYSLLIDK